MKKLLSIGLVLMAIFAMFSCKKQNAASDDATPKRLVLYYSQSGATKAVADTLASLLGADIEAIEAEVPYNGSYQQTIERCVDERNDSVIPKILPLKSKIADYDVIFLGYPIWFGTYASPIKGLLQDINFDGKKIVPFCTFGSGGIEESTRNLKQALPNAEILDGYGVRNERLASMPSEVKAFLVANGYIDGVYEAIPAFSELQPVTDEEKAIFEQACGSYIFPLGTPVYCGSRPIAEGIEYDFKAEPIPFGNVPVAEDVEIPLTTIYVIKYHDPERTPEFTRVVR